MLWNTLCPDESATHSFKHQWGAWLPGMLAVCLLTLAPVQAGALDAETDVHTISAEMETPGDGLLVAQAGPTRTFRIPPQDLQSALMEFSRQADLQLLYESKIASGLKTDGVQGEFTSRDALQKLLSGTPLVYTFTDAKTVAVRRKGTSGAGFTEEGAYLPPVVVTATRSDESVKYIPGSVTVVESKEIEEQEEGSQSLAEILAKMVPGMAPSSQTRTNSAQTLRGRDILVLIDGVPMNTSRNVSRDLFNIDPSVIERIEVVRGATPIYGNGATGGIVHIFTKKAGEKKAQWTAEAGVDMSLTHPAESIRGRLEQGVLGKTETFDYNFNISVDRSSGFFDAEGDRIAPEPSQGDLSDTLTFNLFSKLGKDIDENQRIQFTLNYLDAEQNTSYVSDSSVNAFPARSVKARAVEGLLLDDQPKTQNLMASLDYSHNDVIGSKLKSQLYFRDYFSSFFPFDGRPFAAWNNIAQTRLESQSFGGRLSLETPLSFIEKLPMTLLWGTDYEWEDTKQPVSTFDGTAFDNNGGTVFIKTGDSTFVPPIVHQNVGVFGQVEAPVTDQLLVRTGLRYEYIQADVEGFTTLGAGNKIAGGAVDYSATVFNAGLVYMPVDPVELFFNFTQGFSLPDIGLRLRSAPAGFRVTESNLQPLKVDNYEGGMRYGQGNFNAGVTGFYTESDLGVTSGGFNLTMIRAPERTYGVEADAAYRFNPTWRVGGTFTWIEGENDADLDGDYIALNSLRIPPIKVTSFVEYNPWSSLRTRLQMLYVGSRNRAFEDGVGFGGRPVQSYIVFDLMGQADVGPGTLKFGVENLLNNQYFPLFSQQLRNGQNTSHLAARGATLSLAYSWKW